MNAVVNGAILSLPLTAAVWLALRLLPRRSVSAAARYVIWWIALIATIALPIAYLPPSPRAAAIALTATVAQAGFEAAVFEQAQTTFSRPPATTPARLPIRIPTGTWTRWIAIAWAISALLLLARLIASCATLLRRKRASRPTDLVIPLPRNARLLLSDEIPAPMTVGFLHPAILLPARIIDQLDPEQIRQVALHESAHLARRDDYALIVERAIEAALALHPAVRFIARQIDLEREIACDDSVVRITQHPKSYAACLTRVAEMSGPTSFAAAAFLQYRSQLSTRVDALLDQARATRTRLLKTRVALVAATLIALSWTLTKTPALLAFSTPLPTSQPKSQPAPVPVEPARPQLIPRLIAQAGLAPAAPAPATQPVSVVLLPVQVTTPNGDSVPGLTRDDFTVLENGIQRPVTYFAFDDTPRALEVVVFDPILLKRRTRDALADIENIPGVHVVYANSTDAPSRRLVAEIASSRLQQLPNRHKTLLLIAAQQEEIPQPVVQNDTQLVLAHAGADPPEEMLRSYLATSYVLGYPAHQPDGEYVRTRVLVDRPGLSVLSRAGYYADISRKCSDQIRGALALPENTQCH